MSELREAAQAVINRWYRLPGDNDRAILSDLFARLRAALAQPETESPRDEWRPASEPPEDERAVLVWIPVDYLPTGGVFAIDRCIQSRADPSVRMWSLKPTNWRDVTPPTESPIAAKCQRVEGSGEICGLTPPCPDCGSSLIDVPEGA
jgi:hypothetical protein